jgi:uncharacterized protein (TIGR02145 family)
MVGSEVTINGSNFGANRGTNFVSFNSINAGTNDYISWGDNKIVVKVPSEESTGDVAVCINGCNSNGTSFIIEKYFESVTIGTQVWMLKNLDVTTYRNGDPITNVQDNTEWWSISSEGYCDINNDPSNSSVYGRIYNWYAVNDERNLAPQGWHIATYDDWMTLINYLGGTSVAGGKLKEAGLDHWSSPNTGATNESGFTALGAGVRTTDGGFYYFKSSTKFWTSTADYTTQLQYNWANIGYNSTTQHKCGYSVRCVKD